MLYGNDRLFSIVRSAKLGRLQLTPTLAQLRNWIQTELNVSVVHITFDSIDIGPYAGRPRLNVFLETDADYDSWKTDVVTIRPDIEGRVVARFTKLAQADPDATDTTNVLLTVDNFSDECLGRACSVFLKTDADRITNHFSAVPIWKIDGHSRCLVVFLNTDGDMRAKTADGTCDRISKRCFDAVGQYDEFGYLSYVSFHLTFDSKENLDRNYQGNLFYYWR